MTFPSQTGKLTKVKFIFGFHTIKLENFMKDQPQNIKLRSGIRMLSGLCTAMLTAGLFSGCASGIFHEGAYVGTGGAYESQPRPTSDPSSSVPLFASRSVKDDARNRQAMEQKTGRPVQARPVTVHDVIGWRQAGVEDENIITHIRTHGLYQPIQTQEELQLQNNGVSTQVIRTMREHPYPKVDAPAPPPAARGNVFTRFSSNPDTNPGNGNGVQNSAAGSYASSPVPTLAPPVLPSGDGKPRMQTVPAAPAYGTCVSGECVSGDCCIPEGMVILEDGAWIPQSGDGSCSSCGSH